MPTTETLPVRVPTLRVRHGQPLHERTDNLILLGPMHEMEVVRHQAVGRNPHGGETHAGFSQDRFESPIVRLAFKQLEPGVAPVHIVKRDAGRGLTQGTGHGF